MKRPLFALLMATALMMGCSSDDQSGTTAPDNVVITYEITTNEAQTRTEAISSTNFAQAGRAFKIWALMTDTEKSGATAQPMTSDFNSNPLYNLPVTYANGKWGPDATYGTFYWPRPKYRMDCYAIYPIDAPFSIDSKVIDYSANAVSGNSDVMYATFTGQRSARFETGNATSKPVTLSFNHIFSQVQFTAASSLDVTISEISICNICGNGIFNIGAIGSTPAWGSVNSPKEYPLTLKSQSISLNSTQQPLNDASGMLMLIPQARTAWDTSNSIASNNSGAKGAYLRVRCTIKSGSVTYIDNQDIYSPIEIAWEPGKNYTYTLNFGTGYDANGNKTQMDIILSTTVSDWQDGASENSSVINI